MNEKPTTSNRYVIEWVKRMEDLCKPERIIWCDGSEEEKEILKNEAFKSGELIELNQQKLPGCSLHRTDINDVARTEHLTFICTEKEEDAGPTNYWKSPEEAYKESGEYFKDSMRGRTMYVIPFLMGVPGSPINKVGIELTDSIYVVINMHIMTRVGDEAWEELGNSNNFTKCLHCRADLDKTKRRICHFPEDNTIWSVNSGYGGNVLLGKKCLALRIASYMGRGEGWLAEHMLLMGVETPDGEIYYIAAAFPSSCGKTNLSMLIPPEELKDYKIWTVGDDICWMRIGDDGRLWALNPESGFFGVLPGTNMKTNKNAMLTINRDTIYTNVLLKEDGSVWWEGKEDKPRRGFDWKGDPWKDDMRDENGKPVVGAHPNSRFTSPVKNCPIFSPDIDNPHGVPVSAILFGGRRATLAPLVYEAFNWQHGVYIGATMASEVTSAAMDIKEKIRRDPMAMLPFCGYNMGDYFKHWLDTGKKLTNPPGIFNVNWFRTDDDGKFIWPGFSENLRVLKWVIERCKEESEKIVTDDALKTPIGYVPAKHSFDFKGLDISDDVIDALFAVNPDDWKDEIGLIEKFFGKFGDRLPEGITQEHSALKRRLGFK